MMKAISLWQPWATLLAHNKKIYETRSWETSYRGPLAIHAAIKPVRNGVCAFETTQSMLSLLTALRAIGIVPEEMPLARACDYICEKDVLPVGGIVGIGKLVDCHKIDEAFVSRLSEHEKHFGDFSIGRYAWEFEDMHPVEFLPAKGAQGLWNWQDPTEQLSPEDEGRYVSCDACQGTGMVKPNGAQIEEESYDAESDTPTG